MALTTDEANELVSLTTALVKVRTGQQVTRVVWNGRQTDFAAIDLADLKARVQELESKVSGRRGRAISFRL